MIELMLAAMLAVQSPAEAAQEQAEEAAARVNIEKVKRIATSLREAPSARERALGATMPLALTEQERFVDDARSGEILRQAAEQARGDPLVQMLWALAPDKASGCDERNPCPGRRDALARLEPDNGFAWTPALKDAVKSGDAGAVDAALARIAEATRYDDYFVQGWQAWMAALGPRARAFGAKSDRDIWTWAVSNATMVLGPSHVAMQCSLHRHPNVSAARLDACARVGRLMSRAGTSVMTQRLGLAAVRGAGKQDADDLAVRRELDWLQVKHVELAGQAESNPAEKKAYFADLVATGSEQRAIELSFQRHGISAKPPVGWESPTHD